MSKNYAEIEIDGRQSTLILKYGYPFPEQAVLFEEVRGKKGWHTIEFDKYWLEMIIADLSRSIREVNSQSLQMELDALCSTLEFSLKDNLIRLYE